MVGADIRDVENGIGMPSLWKLRELHQTIRQSFLQQKQHLLPMCYLTDRRQAKLRTMQTVVR